MASRFGPIKSAAHVENAVKDILVKWLNTYIAEVERQAQLPVRTLARPGAYRLSSDTDNWPENQLPAVLIICEGADEPRLDGGSFSRWFAFRLASVVMSNSEANTRHLGHIYASAIEAVLMQHEDLDGRVDAITAGAYSYEPVADDAGRTLGIAIQEFQVKVSGTLMVEGGPFRPNPKDDPDEPYGDFPIVEDTVFKLDLTL